MMDLSIVLLEVAQMRQQDLLRQAEAERRWRVIEELRPSLPRLAFNRLKLVARSSELKPRQNLAPSSSGRS